MNQQNKRKGSKETIISALLIICIGIFSYFFGNDQGKEPAESVKPAPTVSVTTESKSGESELSFRNERLKEQHFQKHGVEMGFSSAEEYEQAAGKVVANSQSLHKIEAEDGDDVYYLEETNELVIVSTDGYIRTFFAPERGIDYFKKQ